MLFNLKSLIHLGLAGNVLEGPIPCGIQNLTALRHLDLSCCNLNSYIKIPSCLYDLPKLEYLYQSFNNLEGEISSAVENMTSIAYLDLSYNSLEGKVPTSVGNLRNLKHINLRWNKLVGILSQTLLIT